MSHAGNSGHLTRVRHRSRKSSATHSYQCVQYLCVSKQWYGCQCLGFLTCAQMLMHATPHRGYTDVIRESALEVDSGRKIVCRTRDLSPCQCCPWLFSQMLYQLSYPCPLKKDFVFLLLIMYMSSLAHKAQILNHCHCNHHHHHHRINTQGS